MINDIFNLSFWPFVSVGVAVYLFINLMLGKYDEKDEEEEKK